MSQDGNNDWGQRTGRVYAIVVAVFFVVAFGAWAFWALSDVPSPLRLDRNYEALFAIMFMVFLYGPGILLMYAMFPKLPPFPTGAPGRMLHAILIVPSYFIARGTVLMLQLAVLRTFGG